MAAGVEIILKTSDRELGSIPEIDFCDARDLMSVSEFAWQVSLSVFPPPQTLAVPFSRGAAGLVGDLSLRCVNTDASGVESIQAC